MIVTAAADPSGPTWLGVVAALAGAVGIGSVLSAWITSRATSRALLTQQERQDERDDKRLVAEKDQRDADRKDALERLREERRHALEDHWRDARHRAHVSALRNLDGARQTLSNLYAFIDGVATAPRDFTLSTDQVMDLRQAVAEVALVGGNESSAAASKAQQKVIRLQFRLRRLAQSSARPLPSNLEDAFEEAEQEALDAIAEYTLAMRRELGVAEA